MRPIFLIGVMVFILTQFVYDQMWIVNETNASIFYYGGIYFSFVLMLLNEIIRSRNVYLLILYSGMILYFVYDIIFSLTLINKPIEFYESEITDMIPCYEFATYCSIFFILMHTIFETKFINKQITKWVNY